MQLTNLLKLNEDKYGWMEDINGLLNYGDLPNLYLAEDKAQIMENMLTIAKQMVCIRI